MKSVYLNIICGYMALKLYLLIILYQLWVCDMKVGVSVLIVVLWYEKCIS